MTPGRNDRDQAYQNRTPIAALTDVGNMNPSNERTPVSYSKIAASTSPTQTQSPGRIGPQGQQQSQQPPRDSTSLKKAPTVDDFPPLPGAPSQESGFSASKSRGSWPDRLSSEAAPPHGGTGSEMNGSRAPSTNGSDVNISTEVVPPLSVRSSPTPPPSQSSETPGAAGRNDNVPLSPITPSMLQHSTPGSIGSASITPSSTAMPITPSPMLRSHRPLARQPAEFAHYTTGTPSDQPQGYQHQHENQNEYNQHHMHGTPGQVIADSLFIGGMDMAYGWTEGKVRDVFSKYGKIENVKIIVKPVEYVGHCFVKYEETSAMARAIKGEVCGVGFGSQTSVDHLPPANLERTTFRRTYASRQLQHDVVS